MRRTLICIVPNCGKEAITHSGHVHLPDRKKITSGFCDEHENYNSTNPSCDGVGCDGDYKDWMRDSRKESQDEMWGQVESLANEFSWEQIKAQFTIKRKP